MKLTPTGFAGFAGVVFSVKYEIVLEKTPDLGLLHIRAPMDPKSQTQWMTLERKNLHFQYLVFHFIESPVKPKNNPVAIVVKITNIFANTIEGHCRPS